MAAIAAGGSCSGNRGSSSLDYKSIVEDARKEEKEALDTLRSIRAKQNPKKEEKQHTNINNKKEGGKGKFNLFKEFFTPKKSRSVEESDGQYEKVGEDIDKANITIDEIKDTTDKQRKHRE